MAIQLHKLMSLLFLALFLTGCGQADSETVNSEENDVPEIITAELIVPEELPTDKEAEFLVKVTQGDQPVNNAKEVQFEFWPEFAKENSEKINAVSQGDGIYTINKSFSAAGTYHVQSHVTAESMHVMPEKVFTVSGKNSSSSGHDAHEMGQDSEADHHHPKLEATLNTKEPAKTGVESLMEVTINHDGEALTAATVTLEITQDKGRDPIWLDLKETAAGHYQGETELLASGSIPVNIHIKKENLHEHIEKTIQVSE